MLPQIWLAMTALAIGLYVLLDGYDLGIGVLTLAERDDTRRRTAIELVATAWDGNESWIVLAGVALFGGMPLAYGALLPALYLPVITMLLALIARGFSIEMQSASPGYDRRWGAVFGAGSLVAALCQGLVLGGVLTGVRLDADSRFAGGAWDFLSWRSVLVALTVVAVYALAGATWLRYRTWGAQAARWCELLPPLVGVLVAASAVALVVRRPSGAAPVALADWSSPRPWLLLLVAVAGLAALVVTTASARRAVLGVVVFEVCALLAVAALTYPYLVPPSLTLDAAAAPGNSLLFLVIGVGLSLPVIAAYTAYAFWVFRGPFALPGTSTSPVPQVPAPARVLAADDPPGPVTIAPVPPHAPAPGHGPVHQPGRAPLRWAVDVVWIVGAFFAALLAMNNYGHVTMWITYGGLAAFSALGLYAWYRSDHVPPTPAGEPVTTRP